MNKTEIFKKKSAKIHALTYDYSFVDYVGSQTKVKIVCKIHDQIFEQTPNDHLRGRGCPLCGVDRIKSKQRLSPDVFLARAQELHGNKVIYDLSQYVNMKTKIDMYCQDGEHSFSQSPEKHLASQACPVCSKINAGKSKASTTGSFIAKAQSVHGNSFDYTRVNYKNNTTPVDVTCNTCNESFMCHPNNHLNGRGCPNCAQTGYKKNKPGFLYIMKCGDITKVGITNLDVKIRIRDISRSFGSDFAVQTVWSFLDGAIADDIETNILRILRSKYERPVTKFEGSSECFLNVDYTELVNLINTEIENMSETT